MFKVAPETASVLIPKVPEPLTMVKFALLIVIVELAPAAKAKAPAAVLPIVVAPEPVRLRLAVPPVTVRPDGTVYSPICNFTQFNVVNNYSGVTAVFTAPKTGRYFITAGYQFLQAGAATSVVAQLVASNRTVNLFIHGSAIYGTTFARTGCCFIDMDTSDTCHIEITISGITKTADLVGGNPTMNKWISGKLWC